MNEGITVSGHGEVEAAPDVATMTFGVSVLEPTVAEAVDRSTESASRLHAALSDAGVAAEDIQTSRYTISPEYDHSGNRRRLVGFRVTNSVQATLRDLDNIGEIIQAGAEAAGDDAHMSGLTFSIEDDAEAAAAARDKAWADALAKAEQLAGSAGVALGAAVSIEETGGARPPTPILRAAMAESAPGAPPIEAGTLTVVVDVTARFQIG